MALRRVQDLRYGENPHQLGARYRFDGADSWWDAAVQHGGKELSYLNLYDTEAAWRLVHRFAEPACVIVKHANPCGVAVAADIGEAYVRANACDPVSAFGGIVAVNRPVTVSMAEALAAGVHRGRRGPRLRTGGADDAHGEAELARAVGVVAGRVGDSTSARSTVDCSSSSPTRSAPIAARGGSSPRRRPAMTQWAGPRVRLGGVRGGLVQRHRARQPAPGLRDRRRPAEPPRLGAHRR